MVANFLRAVFLPCLPNNQQMSREKGQRFVEGIVVETLVGKHSVNQRTCAVMEHQTFLALINSLWLIVFYTLP